MSFTDFCQLSWNLKKVHEYLITHKKTQHIYKLLNLSFNID